MATTAAADWADLNSTLMTTAVLVNESTTTTIGYSTDNNYTDELIAVLASNNTIDNDTGEQHDVLFFLYDIEELLLCFAVPGSWFFLLFFARLASFHYIC